MRERDSVPCPRCYAPSAFVDCDSVDVGVGVIEGNFVYACPEHGEFGWTLEGDVVFRDDGAPQTPEEAERIQRETEEFFAEVEEHRLRRS
jgi:hypothetical protein